MKVYPRKFQRDFKLQFNSCFTWSSWSINGSKIRLLQTFGDSIFNAESIPLTLSCNILKRLSTRTGCR